MVLQGSLAVGREKLDELDAPVVGEARANTDVVKLARLVEQAQEQRSDAIVIALLVPTKPGHDAVAVSLVLHLEHHAFVGLVPRRCCLGDHTVQARALEARKPIAGQLAVSRDRSDEQGRLDVGQQLLQTSTALAERQLAQIALAFREQIEKYDRGRRLLGQHAHARCGWMYAHLQGIEVQHAPLRDHDLSIEHTAFGQLIHDRTEQVGEVAIERLRVATLQEYLVAVTKDQRPEAVPFGFEEELGAFRDRAHALCEHGQDGRLHGQFHGPRPHTTSCAASPT
jgi:hypothetical protein